jgi:LPS export ABC transporter protein LptC/lipopolysaccharide transport protein LptA
MTRWQRRSRLFIAVFGVAFAVFVAREFKHRVLPTPSPVVRSDPGAVVEITSGTLQQFTGSREDVNVKANKQLTYEDGSSKLQGVTITFAERNGDRTFTVTGKEGALGKDQAAMVLDGDVRLAGSDGMTVHTEHATYANGDGTVRAPGPIEFTSGRMRGSGVGMTWESARDVLVVLDQAIVRIASDDKGAGATDVASGDATFARRDKYIRFERGVTIQRSGQNITSATAVAYLTPDGNHIDTVELRGNSRITMPTAAAGGLQGLTSADMNLKYNIDAQSLEHAVMTGDAVVQLAGEPGKPGRQIAAKTLDITLAPDGTTPTALLGREGVQLTFPPEAGVPGRTIKALSLDAKGEPGRGLTRAQFTGSVQYREQGGDVDRAATSASLDLGLKPGMSSIEDARFLHNVRFEEGAMAAVAAGARYDLEKGTLALSGSEPGALVPHVVNQQIVVDASTVDVTLAGPKVKAVGNVKSELRPASKSAKPGDPANNVKMPSMLKQDQAVIVVADTLDYDGTTSTGTYTGMARLFQGDTSIKGETIVIDNKAGNLMASGGVTTTTVLEETNKDKQKQRSQSIANAKDLKYDDDTRRMTYTGDAHMSGPDGDMTATRIELYLKPSGDELDRAEAYENLTLREQNRETKGARMTYTTADEKYIVTGAPVKIVDECQRETIGRTLTFIKATDTIVIDGNAQIRTQTKGSNSKCQS